MGIRMYPGTDDPRTLETLCGVPFGTAEMLEALERACGVDDKTRNERHAGWDNLNDTQRWIIRRAEQDADERFYESMYHPGNRNVNVYHSFKLNGWGKVYPPATMNLLDENGYGTTDDPDKIKAILRYNGLDEALANHISSLHWS